ncbi:MAG: heavy-metal-associated domain-containing protein [Halodesulfurarchaeum sp.]|nr:heavy-metal-associated domain-containing protein [Halodesulfurarchaeum sp.]
MPTTLRVPDMSCDGCEDIVQTALEAVSGVESATADQEAGTAVVEGGASTSDLLEAVDHAGYAAEEIAESDTTDTEATTADDTENEE